MKPLRQKKKQLDGYVKYSNIALQMIVIIGGGIWGGVALDNLTKIEFPVFTLVMSVISVAAAIYVAIKDSLKNK